jgi:hypothetical protein
MKVNYKYYVLYMYVIVYVKMFCSLLHTGSFYTVKFTVPIFNSFVEIFTQIKLLLFLFGTF